MKAERSLKISPPPVRARACARARWFVPLVKLALVLSDATLTFLCFVGAFYVRHYQSIIHRAASGSLSWSRDFAPYVVLLPLIIPIRLLCFVITIFIECAVNFHLSMTWPVSSKRSRQAHC